MFWRRLGNRWRFLLIPHSRWSSGVVPWA